MAETNNIISQYRKLRAKTDRLVSSLEKKHQQHMQCRKGCAECCMDYKIFPVEFYTILEEINELKPVIRQDQIEGECIFLVDNACTIYAFRPLICRTHGLPLIFMNDDDEWELSVCELNFTAFEDKFHTRNTFPQDRFNSELFMLNRKFIEQPVFGQIKEFDLIPVCNLVDKMS